MAWKRSEAADVAAEANDPLRRELILRDETTRPASVDPWTELRLVTGGREDDCRAALLRREPFGDLEAVEIGQVDVEEDDVRLQPTGVAQRRGAIARFADDVEAFALELRAGNPAEALVVVDDEDAGHAPMVADEPRVRGTGSHTLCGRIGAGRASPRS